MKLLKKFWIAFLASMPFAAGAVAPLVVGGVALGVGIIGVSIWRTVAPVNIGEALNFFSSCWTCQIFSDVMLAMSDLLPGVYSALGRIVIPMSATLLVVLTAWRLMSGFFNMKMEDGFKLLGNFGTYIVKLSVLICLLLLPLPKIITGVLVEPALTIGTSLDYVVSDNNKFAECMVATALADPSTESQEIASKGAFSPKLRHQLACELANIHQITGLGMTVGWTMLNMAFNTQYMHKVLKIPVFPNVPVFFVGLLILVLYFFALLPIPLYFLEIFIKLSMDLVMLPLMLMAWMFDEDGFAIFPKGGRTIRQMIDDVIKAIVGIALTVVFLTLSIMFMNALFENANGVNTLQQAITQNNSKILMDGLLLRNSSLILIVLIGIFIAMFMTMIPQLTKMIFNIQISDEYYKKAKDDLNLLWNGVKRFLPGNKKADSSKPSSDSSSGDGGIFGFANTNDASAHKTPLKYIETTGTQYIDTEIQPDSNTEIYLKVKLKSDPAVFLFGARSVAHSNSFALELFHNNDSASVYAEWGSNNNSIDCGRSLSYNEVNIQMRRSGTNVSVMFFDDSHNTICDMKVPFQTFQATCNLLLFCLNEYGNPTSRKISCRFYYCRISQNGTDVRTFLPVLDKDGIPCLYDQIEKKLYYNKGAGNFIAGPKR